MIHETAVVHPKAQLGQGVRVGPLAVIEEDVVLGDGVVVHSQATIRSQVVIGEGTEIHPHAVIGGPPQDLSFKEMRSGVRVGRNCQLREFVTIHRATQEGEETTVGDNCYLMNSTHIAHDVQMQSGVATAGSVLIAGHAEIGENCFFGGNAMVHQFVKIGRLVMVGGGAGITQDVPPFVLLRSCALNVVEGLNTIGLRRGGLGPDERLAIKKAYKKLYRSGLTVKEAAAAIREEFREGPAVEFADFAEAAKRGVCGKTPAKH